jgi:outer membrane lipoprotein carrier protein
VDSSWTVRRTILGVALCGLASLAWLGEPRVVRATPSAPTTSAGDATLIANAVQAFYDQTKDLSASFYQTYVNKLYQRTDRSQGKVVFKKPGMMRWDYQQPNGKIIVSDGKALLVYEPGEGGESGQVVEAQIANSQLPQAMSFLMGTGRLSDNFTFRRLDPEREGFPTGDVLELKPKQPTPQYDRILFYVERTPALRGLVRRLLIIDAAGNRNRFDFSAFKFNANLAATQFAWRPPAGTRVLKNPTP